MYLQVKTEQIKMILMNHGNQELSEGLSFASYDELIFRLQTLRNYKGYFGFRPD